MHDSNMSIARDCMLLPNQRSKADVAKAMKVNQLLQAQPHVAPTIDCQTARVQLAEKMYTKWILVSDCGRASRKPGQP